MKLFIKLRAMTKDLMLVVLSLASLYSSFCTAETYEELDYFESVNRTVFKFK